MAYYILGDVYMEKNDGGRSADAYEKAVELNKKWALPLYKLGLLFRKSKNYNESMRFLTLTMQIDPKFPIVYDELSQIYYQNNDIDSSKYYLEKFITLAENSVETNIRYTKLLFFTKNYDQVITNIKNILTKENTKPYFYRLLGYSYYEKADFASGIEWLTKLFSTSAKDKILITDYEYYSIMLQKMGRHAEAIQSKINIIQKDSTRCDDIYAAISDTMFNQQKYLEAATYRLSKIKCSGKDLAQDYFDLGQAYFFGNYFKLADESFAKLLVLKPNNTRGFWWRARCNVSLDTNNVLGLAKPYFEGFLQHNTDSISETNRDRSRRSLSYLALYYYNREIKDSCKIFAQRVLLMDSTNTQAKAMLNNINIE